MLFIESNILMSLFRIARLLLLFGLDLFEGRRRAKRLNVETQKQLKKKKIMMVVIA